MGSEQARPHYPGSRRRWVIMGVSGVGKTTLGQALAGKLGVPFVEGDTFHPPANVAKMSAGQPLTDADRAGWLEALAHEIGQARARGDGLVVSCSALKRRYRDRLRQADPDLCFVHLQGAAALIERRLRMRRAHYMPPSLLASQLRDLEPLQDDEGGLTLDIGAAPERLVLEIAGFDSR